MTSPDRRLNPDQIKKHPFFYGVDWDSIRRIDAPFIPNLRSITDTSYFPTDEIDQSPAEAPAATADAVQKDLAFLGCVDSLSKIESSLPFYSDIPSRDLLFHLMPFEL